MSKRIIALCCALFIIGFGSGYAVEETMEVPYDRGSLSSLSFVRDGVAYTKIFYGISTSDVTNLWGDLIILESMGVKTIKLYINSPGGDAFSGLALADLVERAQRKGFTVDAYASGIVASAAVPILAVCSKRHASPGTIFMVHETSVWKWPGRETAADIRSQNELMGLLSERYIKKLVDNTDLTKEEWEEMERKTTWFSAEKAMDWGLVDKIE